MAYPETYSSLRDLIESKLQDSSNAKFSTAELDLVMTEGLREIAKYHPYIYRAEYNLENRSGTATATTTGALVDSTESQFLSTDVGKTIYNIKDRTWAIVTAYVSTSQLTISNDIMASGEGYIIFNEGCRSKFDINLASPQQPDGALGSRLIDYLYIDNIEWPILQEPPSILRPGDWEMRERNILHLKKGPPPDDTSQTDAQDEVWIYFAIQHRLSQLTTLLGKVNNNGGYAAGSVSMNVDDLQSSGTMQKGQLFTIDNCRGIYITDYQRTISGNALAPMTFWPPLSDAVDDDATIRFVSNTLDYQLEGIFADLCAGKAAISKAQTYVNKINYGPNPYRLMWEWGKLHYNAAIEELKGIRGYEAPSIALP